MSSERMAVLLIWSMVVMLSCKSSHEHGTEHKGEEGHGHDAHGAVGHDGGAQEEERASVALTRWGAQTQLFVEFPVLVKGQESAFAAHLTQLKDHSPLAKGEVIVELSGEGVEVERFTVEGPTVAGIFRPRVKPTSSGSRRMTLTFVPLGGQAEVHALGDVTVYPDQLSANKANPEGEDTGISFLLEQQWVIPFGIAQAKVQPIRKPIPAFSRLTMPSDGETVLLAPRDGRVVSVGEGLMRVGAQIEEGQAVFALKAGPQEGADPATLDLAVSQASIQEQHAQREVARIGPLAAQGAVAQRRLDDAKAVLDRAQAEVRAAQRRRASFEVSQRVKGRGESERVPSPIRGTLTELFVVSGEWVKQGTPLARIANREQLWLDVFVPQYYLDQLGEVEGAWARFGGAEATVEVKRESLVSMAPGLDPTLKALRVRFKVENKGQRMFAGMSAQAQLFAQPSRQALAIPFDAVVDDSGVEVVYVQLGGERFERRVVRLGWREQEMVEVLSGIEPGEWVAVQGAYSVKLASTSTASVGHGHAH